jgi:hypothetical protein
MPRPATRQRVQNNYYPTMSPNVLEQLRLGRLMQGSVRTGLAGAQCRRSS